MTVGRDHRDWSSQRSAKVVPCVRTPAARPARLLGSFAACVMLVGGGAGSLAFGQPTLLGGVPVLYTPSSVPPATASQNVRPQPFQRATMLDGTVKAGGGIAFSSGNPFASDPGPSSRIGDFDLLTGAYAPFAIDFAGSARGDVGWTIGRTYSQVQTTGSAQHVSDGAQGLNWFQASQPELRIIPDGVSGTLDAAQIVLGADRFIEFAQTAENAATYAAVNGAGGVLERIAADGEGEPQHYIYHQSNGTRTYFFGSGTSGNRADHQLWKIVGADGQTAYVGHPTSAATAASTGYDANRNLLLAYDGANTGAGTSATAGGRRYTYSYTGSIGGRIRLAGVVVEQRTDMTAGGWSSVETVATIEYSYYSGSSPYGLDGQLALVEVTTPLSTASAGSHTRSTRYMYYTGTYVNTINADTGNRGNPGDLKFIFESEGIRQLEHTTGFGSTISWTSAPSVLVPSSAAYFQYPQNDHRPDRATFNGECGCSGGAAGEYLFTYAAGLNAGSMTSGYDAYATSRTVVTQPDGHFATHFFDEAGQPLARLITAGNPSSTGTQGSTWAWAVARDASGMAAGSLTPAALTAGGTWYSTGLLSVASGGLVYGYERESSGTLAGFVKATRVNSTWAGDPTAGTLLNASTYLTLSRTVDSITLHRPLIDTQRRYRDAVTALSTTTGYDLTDYDYTAYSSTATDPKVLAIKTITTTLPTVSSSANGPAVAVAAKQLLREDGSQAFQYEPVADATNRPANYTQVARDGHAVQTIRDVSNPPSSLISTPLHADAQATGATLVSSGIEVETLATYDAQGRPERSTQPAASGTGVITSFTFYTALANGLQVAVTFPREASTTLYGPASMTVTNDAGRAVASGTIDLTSSGLAASSVASLIDTAATDPRACVNGAYGTLARYSEQTYTQSGHQMVSSRVYHDIADGLYDETTYTYDGMGRKLESTDPTGTITALTYDAMGRVTARAIGTATGNMTTVESMVYDDGNPGGNGLVTSRTLHVNASTSRVYETIYDWRGRAMVAKVPVDGSGNSHGVHMVSKYDQAGRVVATGGYSSASGLGATTDPTSVTSNRVSLQETSYDPQGRVYRSRRHKITQSGAGAGSSTDTLDTLTWYDPAGRVIVSHGGSIGKTMYDRLGRVERQLTLAKLGSTAYGDLYDVEAHQTLVNAADVVVEEQRTYMDPDSGLPLMQVAYSRTHTNTGTGELVGTPSDFSAVGASSANWRAQISCTWYDAWNRVTDTASYGTNAGSAFDRDAVTSAPSRSDAVLVQSTSYASDGTVLETTDPKGIKARTVLDDAGRKIKTIANYVDGTSGGGTNGDEDQVVTYTYTNGLMTAMTADLPGSEPDQTTTYAYGVEKGTSTGQSDLAGNRLLHAVTYPAGSYSAGADRQVTYAYNAQGQQRRMVDQAGNVTTTSYDLAGRETSRAVGVVTGFASDVQRIQTAYDARGMVSTVTQYDAQSGGTALDEVAYAYDDWGNLTNFDQDADSTFGGSTSGRWGVAYGWEKAGSSTTPNLLRRTCETLPGGAGLCYGYGSSGSIDAALSRVKTLTLGSTDVAEYEYRGLSQVAGTSLPEAGHESNQYLDSSPSSYGNIDAFGRVSASEWVKSSTGTLTYQTTISYDRNSNITQVLDGVHTLQGWSAQYSMDGLNRVIAADQGLLVESGGTYSVDADWRWRKELWTLNQTGNWSSHSVGDNSGGNNELAETGTFNTANEWTGRTRTTPSTSPTSDTLVYDKVGNMTESGKGEKYVYDGFGRLREVHDWVETAPSTWGWRIHTAYRYNGLGMRLTHEINVDNDADIDGSDVKTYFAYDERWRVVGTYDSPTAAGPTERWVHHAAGLAGSGSSSYIDSVVLRDRDVVLSGTGSSYGGDALEERVYVLQNWRADVVATLGRTGTLIEWIQYTPYGMAVTNPPGNADFNGDGGVDGGDTEAFFLAWEGGLPSADINNDGGVDTADVAAFEDIWEAGETPQAGLCMLTAIRVGYAGYQWDGSVNHDRTVSGAMAGLYHVRHRVYDPELGRWTRRDPAIELISITSSISYCENPIADADPMGEISIPAGASWSELEGPLDLFSDNAILLGSIGSGMEHFPVAGITSIDGAIESCMRHPTISQRVACLENLIDLFPGNQGFETMIRQMISRMKEITKLQKFKNINWLNNKTGRCAALYYTYKTACAACVGCRPGNTDCAVARAMAACWVVCLAGRRAYDSTGCPAGPGHATAQRDVGLAMTKCLGVTLEPRCVGVGGQ